jgi:hypothetical protein
MFKYSSNGLNISGGYYMVSSKINANKWKEFILNVEQNTLYSQKEISELLNFFYNFRKERDKKNN